MQQQDYGVIAPADGRRVVDALQELLGILFGDVARDIGQPVPEYFRNRLGQMSRDMSLLCAEGEEGSQRRLNLPPCCVRLALGLFRKEGVDLSWRDP